MKNRIIIFVFISLAMHAGLIFFYEHDTIIAIAQNAQGSASLSVEILKSENSQKEMQQQPADKNESISRKISEIRSPAATNTISQSRTQDLDSSTEKNLALASTKNEPDFAQVSSILQTSLSRTFYYPKSAQRRNWQGQVLVAFVILSNGKIERVRIDKSSGYTILDRAAVEAIEKIPQQQQLALATNGYDIEQLLPVTYKLVTGNF